MRAGFTIKLLRPGAYALTLACAAPLLGHSTENATESVQALRYGTTLYQYYQQDYLSALTELSTAQQLQALGPHTDGAELLRGGISLSYGMDREAERIFRAELDTEHGSVDPDRAWFYLGKLAWQRGDTSRALQSLDNMSPDYAGDLHDEALYLGANAALLTGNEQIAEAQLAAMPEGSTWRNYLAYNLGAAQASRGNWSTANEYFLSVTLDIPESEEALALRDKSLAAAGYASLAADEAALASDVFQQVRLDGPFSNRALLGYGWAAAAQDDYLGALAPWQQLAQRPALNESVRESLLAVPYAYNQLGRPGIALDNYRIASTQFNQEIEALDAAIVAFRDDPLAPLLGIEHSQGADWLFSAGVLPGGEQAPYLAHLATQHDFQLALKELRDLYAIATNLQQASERTRVLTQVDAHQQQVWASLRDEQRGEQLVERQTALQAKQQDLQQRLDDAIADSSGRLLATPEQGKRWQRLERAQQSAQTLNANDEVQHTLRIMQGLLQWQDNEDYPARAWWARQQLQALSALAKETDIARQRADSAIANYSESQLAPRISAVAQRIDKQSVEIDGAIARAEQSLRTVAIAELERQSQQLARALGQSQLAIAQIHDKARGMQP